MAVALPVPVEARSLRVRFALERVYFARSLFAAALHEAARRLSRAVACAVAHRECRLDGAGLDGAIVEVHLTPPAHVHVRWRRFQESP